MAENIKFPSRAVIDASVALAFLLPDEKKNRVDQFFQVFVEGKTKIITPEIFHFEVFNGLRSAVLRKRISSDKAKKLLKNFLKFNIKTEKVDWLKTFVISLKQKISFYDATYLSLSKSKKIPLLSLDKLLVDKS